MVVVLHWLTLLKPYEEAVYTIITNIITRSGYAAGALVIILLMLVNFSTFDDFDDSDDSL